ncbi:hypothetical protein FOXG_15075 [Fusarium oxysporum f. sp. lycopersici 4287]|uniref:Uncharacterized protein n=2 Tax=Fusarium oxysporum TaxID=5507 RepID=A0A0J9W3U6_FUSO4|nr:hypothetical protein FOXG_15075 [Fusarium oxysporum f. sp. lycopersici 4287]KNB17575.1 hypothetical protein FOXG_15075 [Fusarium oxysporum f. sp. lycopersici 4287]
MPKALSLFTALPLDPHLATLKVFSAMLRPCSPPRYRAPIEGHAGGRYIRTRVRRLYPERP